MSDEILNKLKSNNLVKESDYYLIHTSLMRSIPLKKKLNKQDLLNFHFDFLKEGLGENVWFPTFNYDFPKSKIFDLVNDKSQIGVLNTFAFKERCEWRSETPIFSFTGFGEYPLSRSQEVFTPFKLESEFGYLYNKKSLYVHYGSLFSNTTLIHFIEEISGNLLYRYNKKFHGHVVDENENKKPVTLDVHVRPLEGYLDYDWDKMELDLDKNGVIQRIEKGGAHIILFKLNECVDFLLSKMKEDPFYMLDEESKKWVIPKVEKLGRGFHINDFE